MLQKLAKGLTKVFKGPGFKQLVQMIMEDGVREYLALAKAYARKNGLKDVPWNWNKLDLSKFYLRNEEKVKAWR